MNSDTVGRASLRARHNNKGRHATPDVEAWLDEIDLDEGDGLAGVHRDLPSLRAVAIVE